MKKWIIPVLAIAAPADDLLGGSGKVEQQAEDEAARRSLSRVC